MQIQVENVKAVGDAISISVILGTLADWLPAVAAVISIIWGVIRIVESKTFQYWCGECLEYLRKKKHKPDEQS